MNSHHTISFLLILLLALSGCEQFNPNKKAYKENLNINITDIEFEPDYKRFHLNVEINDTLTALLLSSNADSIHFKTEEFLKDNSYNLKTQPQLESYENLRLKEIKELKFDALFLIDLTLDSTAVNQQHQIVRNLTKLFDLDHLHVSFMKNNEVSPTMIATDYVMDNYFKYEPGEKHLYRAISSKIEEFKKDSSEYVGKDKENLSTDLLMPARKIMFIFSDGKVYNHNQPIDSKHFELQHQIVQQIDTTQALPIFYFNLEKGNEDNALREKQDILDKQTDEESQNFLTAICHKSGGKFINTSTQQLKLNDILHLFNNNYINYTFNYVNPDYKIYRGMERKLQITCYSGDSLVASDYILYNVGSIYNPIIINGSTTLQTILQGCFIGIITILLLYLIFQFILPGINYWLFKRKYVTRYTGKNMSYNGMLIEQSCYFCKAPFVEGDEIVAKCQHVLHKSCWDENEYQCPEYGRHCKQGRHYYNCKNLFDPHNASFYLAWIIAGAFAGLIAWINFTANVHNNENLLLVKLIYIIFGVDSGSPQTTMLVEEYGSHLLFLPFYGLNIGFFLTFSLSILTSHGRWLWKRTLQVIVRSLIGGFFSYLSFFIGCIISIALNFKDNSFLIDWIPWMLSGLVIASAVAYGTDIKLKKALIGAVISIIFGLGSMYLWSFSFNAQVDTHEFLLLSYMIYCIGFAISVAATSPKSERYFLRVEGPIKDMDIAIYKWMKAPEQSKKILIGKSVNCDLQMTWDITSPIAPEQAEVKMINGYLYLTALEEGILFNKKPLKTNIRKKLYHGTKFVIGKTTFTYLEKDL